jgi:hypothetical protein
MGRQEETSMSDLVASVIDAHGGLIRWRQHRAVTTTLVTGGGLWAMKGLIQDRTPRTMWASRHEEHASVAPFGKAGWPDTLYTLHEDAHKSF